MLFTEPRRTATALTPPAVGRDRKTRGRREVSRSIRTGAVSLHCGIRKGRRQAATGGDRRRRADGNVEPADIRQTSLENDPNAEATLLGPRRQAQAMYDSELDRMVLDGFVFPAIQMPPVDETMPRDGRLSEGPHSATGWVNMLGVPAISIPAGFYYSGLPFGIEISTRKWHDGDLISWAYD